MAIDFYVLACAHSTLQFRSLEGSSNQAYSFFDKFFDNFFDKFFDEYFDEYFDEIFDEVFDFFFDDFFDNFLTIASFRMGVASIFFIINLNHFTQQ